MAASRHTFPLCMGHRVRLCGYMCGSDVVEVSGGSWESHDVHRFIHHSSSIKLTRALPPILHIKWPVRHMDPISVMTINYRVEVGSTNRIDTMVPVGTTIYRKFGARASTAPTPRLTIPTLISLSVAKLGSMTKAVYVRLVLP
jgi:hypothetical protein